MCMEGRSYGKERGRTRERKKEEWIEKMGWTVRGRGGEKPEKGSGDEFIRQVGLGIDWKDWDWQKMEAKPVLRSFRNGELARNMMLG